jgi:hypothetical protein
MADAPRITVQELRKRMDAGEDFTVIDVRNPNAWAETDTVLVSSVGDQCADRTPHQEGQSAKRLPTVRQARTLGIDALPEQHV